MQSAYEAYCEHCREEFKEPLPLEVWLTSLRGPTATEGQISDYNAYIETCAQRGVKAVSIQSWLSGGSGNEVAWDSIPEQPALLPPGIAEHLIDVASPHRGNVPKFNGVPLDKLGIDQLNPRTPYYPEAKRVTWTNNWGGGNFNVPLSVGVPVTLILKDGTVYKGKLVQAHQITGQDHDHGHTETWHFTDYYIGMDDDPFLRHTSLLTVLKADSVAVYVGDLTVGKILYREHRGSLEDSMATRQPLDRSRAAITAYINCIYDTLNISADQLVIKPYAHDERIGWDSYIITVEGTGVLGFTNGPVLG